MRIIDPHVDEHFQSMIFEVFQKYRNIRSSRKNVELKARTTSWAFGEGGKSVKNEN